MPDYLISNWGTALGGAQHCTLLLHRDVGLWRLAPETAPEEARPCLCDDVTDQTARHSRSRLTGGQNCRSMKTIDNFKAPKTGIERYEEMHIIGVVADLIN